MKPEFTALARTFLAATGATCLDEATVTRGLAAVLAEQHRLASLPAPNEMRVRRLMAKAAPLFAAFEAETGINARQLVAPAQAWAGRSDPLTGHRDLFIRRLADSTAPAFSLHEVALIAGRTRAAVRKALAREAVRSRVAGNEAARRVSHG